MKTKIMAALAGMASLTAAAQTPLFIPDTLTGSTINLAMHRDSVQFFPGQITQTFAYNNYNYLGPTLIMNAGTNISLNVDNQLQDTTTVHWHGLHIAAQNDGGPHTVIPPGQIWNPQFTILDKASTFWYHPHTHMKTAEQAMKGAAGLIIMRDAEEAALNLPRRYGTDDFPVIVQTHQFDSLNQIDYLGMQDSTLLVNGGRANYGYSVYLDAPSQVIRFRMLNAAGERSFNFGFSNNMPFYVTGNDGGLLSAPVNTTRIRLSPGERAELLLDLNGMNGDTIFLICYGSELPMGVQGGPTMPMPPPNPPMDSPLNGVDYNVMQINIGAQTANPVTSIPSSLVTVTPYLELQANTSRSITFSADNMMNMDGPFYFNGLSFDMERIDYYIPLNNIEVWTLDNQTMVAHPFHIHGLQFYILDRDGNPPAPEESGRKDLVLVQPNEVVRFIAKFEDFEDTIVPYMYHCHILMHEDDGMMGQYLQSSAYTGINEISDDQLITAYPNPAEDMLTIVSRKSNSEIRKIIVRNAMGQIVYQSAWNDFSGALDVSLWCSGIYIIAAETDNRISIMRFIKK